MSDHAQSRMNLEGHIVRLDIDVNLGAIADTPAISSRIAACWNACIDIDTEQLFILEDNDTTLKKRYEALQAQMKVVQLAKKHEGMRGDYSGMLGQACRALKRSEPGKAEMLRQLQNHLTEMGKRFYAGDFTVVDEFLQLYCVANEDRERVVAERNKEAA